MGQIIGEAAKPKRTNLSKMSNTGTGGCANLVLGAGEYMLVSSEGLMNAAGQGDFDFYIVGDGTNAVKDLPLKKGVFDETAAFSAAGQYVFTGYTDGQTCTYTKNGGAAYGWAIVDVSEGDVVILSTRGNTANARAYTFVDRNDVVLSSHQSAVTHARVVVPQNAVKMIVNSYVTTFTPYILFPFKRYLDIEKKVLSADSEPTINSDDLLKSGGTFNAIQATKEEILTQLSTDGYEGKVLVDSEVASSFSSNENDEFVEVHLDKNNVFLYGIRKDGTFVLNNVPSVIQAYVLERIEALREELEPEQETDEIVATSFTSEYEGIVNANIAISNKISAEETDAQITITNQQEFSSLPSSILSALVNNKKNISVIIKSGTYYCEPSNPSVSDGFIALINSNYPDVNISINGEEGCFVLSKGGDYVGSNVVGSRYKIPYTGVFDTTKPFCDEKYNYVEVYNQRDFTFSNGLIQVDENDLQDDSTTAWIANTGYPNMTAEECSYLYVAITQWYRTLTYKVVRIENGNIYFTWTKPTGGYGGYNTPFALNNDYGYGRTMPRFKLINFDNGDNLCIKRESGNDYIYVPTKYKEIHEGGSSIFLEVRSANFNSVSVSHINFRNSQGRFLWFNHVECNSVSVEGCSFFGCYQPIYINDCDNIHITNNNFSEIYRCGIRTGEDVCDNMEITNNHFYHTDYSMDNYGTIRLVACTSFLVAKNTFVDYGYSAIYIGTRTQTGTSGIVEGNTMRYSDEVFCNPWKYCVMDNGSIYTSPNLEDVVIRYNNIINFNGMKDNRGIFCDDGTRGVSVLGNLIINVLNSHAIDLRRVDSVETNPAHNTNNVFLYNIISSSYKMEGMPNDISSIKGRNILLGDVKGNVVNNCEQEDDCIVREFSQNGNLIVINKELYGSIVSVLPKEIYKNFVFKY